MRNKHPTSIRGAVYEVRPQLVLSTELGSRERAGSVKNMSVSLRDQVMPSERLLLVLMWSFE